MISINQNTKQEVHMSQHKKINVAIIGCGAISDAYMTNLKTRFTSIQLTACSDLNIDRMNEKASCYDIRAMSFEDILKDSGIDMIINLTNPAAHYPIIKAALTADKHVYSEKMLATTFEQATELCAIADKQQKYLGVAPDTFLGGTIQTARYLIDHGMIGRPLSCMVSLSRDFEIFGEILPHLRQSGGDLAMDTGCYYLVALASLFGPAETVAAFKTTNNPDRIMHRIDRADFQQSYHIDVENVMTAAIRYKNGLLGSLHINSDCIFNENRIFRIFGTEGIINIDDPNKFGSKITIQKPFGEEISFPLTHGFQDECRGIGAAEMAWAIIHGRPNRASKEMGLHVLEMIQGMFVSSGSSAFYQLESSFEQPAPLPAGYVSGNEYGMWAPTEETALV